MGRGEMSEAQFTDFLMSEILTAGHQVMLAPAFLAFVREPWLANKCKSTQNAMIPCKAGQIIRDT